MAGIWNVPPTMAFSNFSGSSAVQVTSVVLDGTEQWTEYEFWMEKRIQTVHGWTDKLTFWRSGRFDT